MVIILGPNIVNLDQLSHIYKNNDAYALSVSKGIVPHSYTTCPVKGEGYGTVFQSEMDIQELCDNINAQIKKYEGEKVATVNDEASRVEL